eukprot:SAG31_NODE_1804_length_7234_cov_3.340855_5_plen_463_part_00
MFDQDGWIYGVPSDPLKNAQFREAARQRASCIVSGRCNPASPAMRAFDRLLVKVPEHTWGVAQSWFLPDYENYTNVQFDLARSQQSLGFIKNNTKHADYNTTVGSWVEQRTFVTQAPALLAEEHPELAANLSAELHRLKYDTGPPSLVGFVPSANMSAPISCGTWDLQFNSAGGLTKLLKQSLAGVAPVNWANPAKPIGQFLYQSFDDADYNIFLKDFGSRIGDRGIWPEHTAGRYAGYNTSTSDMGCGNFCKKNMSAAGPRHRELAPTLTGIWHKLSSATDGCEVITRASMPIEAQNLAGAPAEVIVKLHVEESTIDWEVVWMNKRPTRLPESIFFSFNPDVPTEAGWELSVLGSMMDPTDVLGSVGEDYLSSTYGGSPHLRGVEFVKWKGPKGQFTLSSLDVPIICTGAPTPFVAPRTGQPDMSKGVHYNIFREPSTPSLQHFSHVVLTCLTRCREHMEY